MPLRLEVNRYQAAGGRRISSAPRTFITDIGPYAGRGTFAFGLHFDRGVIRKDGLASAHMTADGISQGFQQCGRAANPIRQGGTVQINPVPSVDLRLPVQRAVVCIFSDQHMGQKAGPRTAALNRAPLPAELQDNSPAGQWMAAQIERYGRSPGRPCAGGQYGSPVSH